MIHQTKWISLIFLGLPCTFSVLTPKTINRKFTRADTLRGSYESERGYYNVLKYEITIEPDYETESVTGKNRITYIDSGNSGLHRSHAWIDLQIGTALETSTAGIVQEVIRKLGFERRGECFSCKNGN